MGEGIQFTTADGKRNSIYNSQWKKEFKLQQPMGEEFNLQQPMGEGQSVAALSSIANH